MSRGDPNIKLQQLISAEITSQLTELKEQLNREIVEDFNTMKELLRKEIIEDIKKYIELKNNKVERIVDDKIQQEMTKMNQAVVSANSSQQAVTKHIVQTAAKQIQTQVYNKILGEINEKIVPKVDNMVQWVNYNMQDGAEVVNNYRRAVEKQSRPSDNKLLTDGSDRPADSRVISQHVRTVFSDSD